MKIEYFLAGVNDSLVFSVYSQDTKFTSSGTSTVFKATNGWYVASNEEPDINVEGKVIFLRGRNATKDKKVVVVPSQIHSKFIIKEIEDALIEWAKDWEGWDADKFTIKVNQ